MAPFVPSTAAAPAVSDVIAAFLPSARGGLVGGSNGIRGTNPVENLVGVDAPAIHGPVGISPPPSSLFPSSFTVSAAAAAVSVLNPFQCSYPLRIR